MRIGNYAKSIAQVLAAGISILVVALSDNRVDPAEFVNIIIAMATAVGVYVLPNLDHGPGTVLKTIVSFVGAAASALINILSGSLGWNQITLSDWLVTLLAGLAAIGVYIVPNTAPTVANLGHSVRRITTGD